MALKKFTDTDGVVRTMPEIEAKRLAEADRIVSERQVRGSSILAGTKVIKHKSKVKNPSQRKQTVSASPSKILQDKENLSVGAGSLAPSSQIVGMESRPRPRRSLLSLGSRRSRNNSSILG